MKKKEKHPRLAIVIHRFGADICGGAEWIAYQLATRLAQECDIEILTSTSTKTNPWNNHYPMGASWLDGVVVRRFPVAKTRDEKALYQAIEQLNFDVDAAYQKKAVSLTAMEIGPYCPALIKHIKNHQNNYDAFLFITYYFYLAIAGIPLVADKSIFMPTAHDEQNIRLSFYHEIFHGPKDFLFLSHEERALVHKIFGNGHIRNKVVGVGIEPLKARAPISFSSSRNITEYVIYVGRVEKGKQCDQLVCWFSRFKECYPSDLKLVMMGNNDGFTLHHADIVYTGYVSEQEKFDALSGAKFMIMPSKYESLCIATLEALSVGTPILVNAHCTPTVGHCIRGNCGLYYNSYQEFETSLNRLLSDDHLRSMLGQNGMKYVEDNYKWDTSICYIKSILSNY